MFRNLTPITKNLLIINVLIYAVMALSPVMHHNIEQYGALYYFTSPGFRIWQPVSYMFIHASFQHLFFNMLALFFFGPIIERALGRERFLFFYLLCGIGAAFIQTGVFAILVHKLSGAYGSEAIDWAIGQFWNMAQSGRSDVAGSIVEQGLKYRVFYLDGMNQVGFQPNILQLCQVVNTPTVGASGAIYGILGAAAILFPNVRVYLYFAIPVKLKWLVIGYAILELAQGIGGYATTVAHFAHLGGMLVGVLYILQWRKKNNYFNTWY